MSGPWWQEYYDDIDNQRLDSLESRTHPDVVVRMGGSPPVKGVAAAIAGQKQFATMFTSLRHDFVHTWEVDDTAILEAVVTYVRHDDKAVEVPCVSIVSRKDGLVDSVRVYLDLAPLFRT